jgi:hypothetical protein
VVELFQAPVALGADAVPALFVNESLALLRELLDPL